MDCPLSSLMVSSLFDLEAPTSDWDVWSLHVRRRDHPFIGHLRRVRERCSKAGEVDRPIWRGCEMGERRGKQESIGQIHACAVRMKRTPWPLRKPTAPDPSR